MHAWHQIELRPGEHIVNVSGYTDTQGVRSLTFTTSQQRIFGPYGIIQGTPFNLPIEQGSIVGFRGSTGDILQAISIHLA